jgi:hypothetical protein
MRLACESCGQLHIDEGEFATKPHHTHACQMCGLVWRPALVATVGVRFLPGFASARERASCKPAPLKFVHGARVKLKNPKKGEPKTIGRIVGYPRGGSIIANVMWPNGYGGYCRLDELEVVEHVKRVRRDNAWGPETKP